VYTTVAVGTAIITTLLQDPQYVLWLDATGKVVEVAK
jgi:hypothetical protein